VKRITLAIVIAVAFAGHANAGERQSLEAVKVSSSAQDCTPPNASSVCRAWHEEIRRNFSSREIGMLFGAATSYPEYQTSYSKVKARYDRLQEQFAANHMSADAVAAK
jgi:hypothetical protein